MKAKQIKLKDNNADNASKKSYDFVNYYKSATETTVKLKSSEKTDVIEAKPKPKIFLSSSRKQNKRKQNPPESLSTDDVKDNSANNSTVSNSVVFTNNNMSKKEKGISKPIIKNANDTQNSSPKTTDSKPKKRNKSVSFMLEENEEVAVKKNKSEKSAMCIPSNINKNKNRKRYKKDNTAEKENKSNSTATIQLDSNNKNVLTGGNKVLDLNVENFETNITKNKSTKRKNKAHNKHKEELNEIQKEQQCDNTQFDEKSVSHDVLVSKKIKKKKHSAKPADVNVEDEPQIKSQKKDLKPEVVAEDLENLNIGDNTHTLTNLLDEMAVADKKKHKKNKKKLKKGQQAVESSSAGDQTEGKIKEKWTKKRWNKDKKPCLIKDQVSLSVVVDNLPIKIILDYKKLLAEHFSKCGTIKGIGVAEVYPSEDPKPVFTTTIFFENETAVQKALEEDNTPFEGTNIRVKQPLPLTETTLVVRSYAELSSQALSSTFGGAGRIRNIRHLVKGKKSMATGFVEFDGPVALNRALQLAEGVKIDNKKIYVLRFEVRAATKPAKPSNHTVVKKNDEDSDSSDD